MPTLSFFSIMKTTRKIWNKLTKRQSGIPLLTYFYVNLYKYGNKPFYKAEIF